MAYTPTVWATGDIITAEKLNKMEQGIAGAGLQLYGPYFAANSAASLAANDATAVTLSTLEDNNGATVNYPEDSTAKLLMCGLSSGSADGMLLQEVTLPYYSNGSWKDGSMLVYNNTASAASEYVYVKFYSTVEFPQES